MVACSYIRKRWIAFALPLSFFATSIRAQEPTPTEEEIGREKILMSKEEGLKEVFPDASSFESEVKTVSTAIGKEMEDRMGRPLEEKQYTIDLAKDSDEKLLGYAIVLDEKGKYRPITMLVGVTPHFEVKDVAVLVYRESRGGEISRKRFLRQFKGKSLKNALRVHKDIIHITGATISAYAVTSGTRKALMLAKVFYGSPKGEAP